jgi:hypothetical protein
MRNLVLDIGRMASLQLSSLFDSCTVDQYTVSSGSYGELIKQWVAGSPISCGYTNQPGKKLWSTDPNTTKSFFKALFRLPASTVITVNDRITLIAVMGIAVTPIQYQVTSIELGKGLLLVGCESVTL